MIARAAGGSIPVWRLIALSCLGAVLFGRGAKAEPFPPVPQELQVTTPRRVRISQGVSRALLIKKVEPDYPAQARSKHIQGQVVMRAFISKSGDVEELYPVSGHELLVPSATNAVKKWKYKPYYFQGLPVEVETQITVVFTLDGG